MMHGFELPGLPPRHSGHLSLAVSGSQSAADPSATFATYPFSGSLPTATHVPGCRPFWGMEAMQKRLRDSCRVEYDDVGSGLPVVLLHAFPLARIMWRLQVEALQGKYRVVTPDLRGFGGTDGFNADPSIDQMAEDVKALLDELSVEEPVALGGLSMGGYIALAFARKYADRLRALFLADTRSEPDNAEGKANRDKLIAFAQSHTARDVIEQMLPKMLSGETLAHRPDVVALPSLVIVGRDDALTPPAMAESLAAKIRGARFEIIPLAGHLSNLEQPEGFNRAVRSFLDSLV
jgi:pimeloyl-ACP methyl ester carboxylesterase